MDKALSEYPHISAAEWPAIKARIEEEYGVMMWMLEKEMKERGFSHGVCCVLEIIDGQCWQLGVTRVDMAEHIKDMARGAAEGTFEVSVVKVGS